MGFDGALKDQRPWEKEGKRVTVQTKVLRQVRKNDAEAELPGREAGQRRKSSLDLGRP